MYVLKNFYTSFNFEKVIENDDIIITTNFFFM